MPTTEPRTAAPPPSGMIEPPRDAERPEGGPPPPGGPASMRLPIVLLAAVGTLILLVIIAMQLSTRLRSDLETELGDRLRIAATLVSEALEGRAAAVAAGATGDNEANGNAGDVDGDLAIRLEEIREATSVTDIALYDRSGGFLGGSVSGPSTGTVPRRIHIADDAEAGERASPSERSPRRDAAGGLTLVVPLGSESGGGALLTRIDSEGRGGLAGVDLLFTTAKILAAILAAAGFLFLLRWIARGGKGAGTIAAPIGTGSDVDVVLGTMKEVMTSLKDSETDWRDRWSAAEADADQWRRTSDLILESIGSGIVAFDRGGRITLFNRAAEEMFGFGSRHALGRGLGTVFGEDDALVRLAEELIRGGRAAQRTEVERPGPDGESHWLGISVSRIRSSHGEEIGGMFLLADLTETRRLRSSAALRDRLAAVGEMTAGIAHEIKNCLHSMAGYENLLKDDLDGDEPSMAVRGILSEAGSLEGLVKGMLEFSRPSALAREPTDVAILLRDVGDATGELAREHGIEVRFDGPENGVRADVDPDAIRGVFRNLALNAIEAMNDGGLLSIGLRTTEIPDERVEGALSGRLHRISFRDDGPGIAEENRARIFTPFWTTKRDGHGLGLALAHKTITDHGGRVHLHSRVGVGTEFVILLPADES